MGGRPKDFTAKYRDWNKVEVMEAWSQDTNAAIERAGREARADHRPLVAQRDETLERTAAVQDLRRPGAELEQTCTPSRSTGRPCRNPPPAISR